MRYFLGLSLGQIHEFTALAVLESHWTDASQPGVGHHAARHLERFALGTSYREIVSRIKSLCATKPLRGASTTIDRTGVGKPVVDQFKSAGINAELRSVVVTTGHGSHFEDGTWHVPKLELVGVLQVLLQSRRLKVAMNLPDAGSLVDELALFRTKPAPPSRDPYLDWRDGPQDDLVLAVAVAAWYAEREGNVSNEQPAAGPVKAGWEHRVCIPVWRRH